MYYSWFIFIHQPHPSIHPSISSRLTPWPYLLQHIHRVPAALQSGGEAGCRRGIVILRCLREKLGHRYLIRHHLTGKMPTAASATKSSEKQNHERFKNSWKAQGVWCRGREARGKSRVFLAKKKKKKKERKKNYVQKLWS